MCRFSLPSDTEQAAAARQKQQKIRDLVTNMEKKISSRRRRVSQLENLLGVAHSRKTSLAASEEKEEEDEYSDEKEHREEKQASEREDDSGDGDDSGNDTVEEDYGDEDYEVEQSGHKKDIAESLAASQTIDTQRDEQDELDQLDEVEDMSDLDD